MVQRLVHLCSTHTGRWWTWTGGRGIQSPRRSNGSQHVLQVIKKVNPRDKDSADSSDARTDSWHHPKTVLMRNHGIMMHRRCGMRNVIAQRGDGSYSHVPIGNGPRYRSHGGRHQVQILSPQQCPCKDASLHVRRAGSAEPALSQPHSRQLKHKLVPTGDQPPAPGRPMSTPQL